MESIPSVGDGSDVLAADDAKPSSWSPRDGGVTAGNSPSPFPHPRKTSLALEFLLAIATTQWVSGILIKTLISIVCCKILFTKSV